MGAGRLHLHTKADKEFGYAGEDNAFAGAYVDALKKAGIGIGVIANHNKFDMGEFKALRSRVRKEGIAFFPASNCRSTTAPTACIAARQI